MLECIICTCCGMNLGSLIDLYNFCTTKVKTVFKEIHLKFGHLVKCWRPISVILVQWDKVIVVNS